MSGQLLLILLAFLMVTSLVAMAGLWVTGRNRRVEVRLQELSGKPTELIRPKETSAGPIAAAVRRALPKMGERLLPDDNTERTLLRGRLILAGFYSPQAPLIFLGVKLLLMVTPVLLGALMGAVHIAPLAYCVLTGACLSIFGTIIPSFWLDHKKAQRQMALRRALPDACDLLVICLEGGLSLAGALQRVGGELRTAHPLLADELNIVQRKVSLGEPLAVALASFATRCDLQEMQAMASVVKSAEQYGSSMVTALQNYSIMLRIQRQQHAEEMAQKASTKILFPTLIFIFPSILIIIL
ncbi:MAG: type II secretion system F family protein, partial [Planctomycetes bacterium]|nr:type II secretion system F family protein [Planctomycetota bacterium]